MRTITALVLVGLCALAAADPVNVDKFGKQYKVADKVFLEKQKDILRLLKHVIQLNGYPDQVAIAKSYNIEDNLDLYVNQDVVHDFLGYYKQGLLPRGEVLSLVHDKLRKQTVALAKVLYYAKDWDTFYKTACWARDNVHEGSFVYALTVAVFHRQDTQGIVLPPMYEIYPYFFVNGKVIDKAYEYKMKYGGVPKTEKSDVFYIQANYSGSYINVDPEQSVLSYFTEDIALNTYHFYFNLDYPGWMDGEEFGLNKDRRGEMFTYFYQQLLARYYLERLSNDLGAIPVFDWEEPIKTGYQCLLRYPNGQQFSSRPAWTYLTYNPHNQGYTNVGHNNQLKLQQVQDYERRIREAIDSGYIVTEEGKLVNIYEKEGFNILGNLIAGNQDSPNYRYYGHVQALGRVLLGYSPKSVDGYKVTLSALETHITSLRDPVFYQFYKRLIHYVMQYKANLPKYTNEQLNFPGVKIEDVKVDKLVTYFDNFDFDITNALYLNEQEFEQDSFQVRARQWRLNNKPYTYKINVQSDKKQDVVVRVFLGPKYDEHGHEIPLNENRVNFVELDKFVYTLEAGKNLVVRNSVESRAVKDRTTYRTLYQQVMNAIQGTEEFHLDMSEAHNGFPARLVLPKGKVSGQAYQLYVYISPYHKHEVNYDNVVSAGVGSGTRHIDDLPFLFPLDRPIEHEEDFYVPNSFVEDVTIYHKTEKDINTSKY